MTEKDESCKRVDEYLQDSWGLKANRGDLRDIIAHLNTCDRHPESALTEARLAALLVEDREAISVPPLLRQKVSAIREKLRKRRTYMHWSLRLAAVVTLLIVVVYGLVGRPKEKPPVRLTEPGTFEESFFATEAQTDEAVGLWVEASYTLP